MNKANLEKQLHRSSLLIYAGIISVVWGIEGFWYFYEPPHSYLFNWGEALFETACILIFLVIRWRHIRKLVKRLDYLEGFVRICSVCKNVAIDEEKKVWIPIEVFLSDKSVARFSHGFCPHCYEEYKKKIEEYATQSKLDAVK